MDVRRLRRSGPGLGFGLGIVVALGVVPAVPLAVGAAPPTVAGAATTTFGANLSGPVETVVGTCPRDSFLGDKGGPSCIVGSASAATITYAPQSGIVNTVRVKTGDVPQGTGKMQIMVERSFVQNNPDSPGKPNFFCCFIEQYGPVFTPQRNAVNTITRADLGFVEQPTPPPDDFNTVAKDDFLSLSILGSDVPIPAGQDPFGFLAYGTPAPNPATTPAPSLLPYTGNTFGEAQGFNVLMNADLEPLAVPPPDTAVTAAKVHPARHSATLSFIGSGGVGALHFKCKLDHGGFGRCSSPVTFSQLASGNHTFQVRAVDSRGIADPTPAVQHFHI